MLYLSQAYNIGLHTSVVKCCTRARNVHACNGAESLAVRVCAGCREVELGEQRVEQKNLLLHARQRLLRSKETLAGERSASTGLHAQDLVERLAEDNRLKASPILMRVLLHNYIDFAAAQESPILLHTLASLLQL